MCRPRDCFSAQENSFDPKDFLVKGYIVQPVRRPVYCNTKVVIMVYESLVLTTLRSQFEDKIVVVFRDDN